MTFDHLDHLDDPDAPPFDGSTYDALVGRARRRRVRRRIRTTGGAVVVAITLVGVAIVGAAPDRGARVVAIRPPATTGTTLDPSIWVTASVLVDQSTIPVGGEVTGTVVFENRTNRDVNFTDSNGCLEKWTVAISAAGTTEFAFTAECRFVGRAYGASQPSGPGSRGGQYLAFAPGTTTVAFRLPARFGLCVLPCEGRDRTLPPGPAQVRLGTSAPSISHLAIADPVPIAITAAG